MKIGITGPSNIKRVCEAISIGEEEYYAIVRSIAEKIAKTGHEIIIIPAKRSSTEFFAEVYRDEDGTLVTGIVMSNTDNSNNNSNNNSNITGGDSDISGNILAKTGNSLTKTNNSPIRINTSWLNKQVCDELIECNAFEGLHFSFLKNCDALLCLGFCPDSLIALCYTKWLNNLDKIYVIKELISEKLPAEIEPCLRITYVDSEDIGNLFK